MELQQNFETNASIYLRNELSKRSCTLPKQLYSQIIAVLVVNILSIEVGFCIGFIKIIISYLDNDNSDINVSVDELTWITSIWFLTTAIGFAVHCLVFKFVGRRQILLCLSFPLTIEWTMIYFSENAKNFIIGLGLLGLNCGIALGPITTYTIEVSKPHKRDIFLSLRLLAMSFGTFLEVLISYLFGWKVTIFVNFGLATLAFIALLFIPESPHWLASRGQLNESEKALCWLRGWASVDEVRPEFRAICKIHAKRGYPVGIDGATMSRDDCFREETLFEKLQPYRKRTFWVPLILLIVIFFIKAFGGTVVTQSYSSIIFNWLKPPLEINLASFISGIIEMVASFIGILISYFIGKRNLTIISVFILSIFCFLLGLYCSVRQDDTFIDSGTQISFFLIIGITILTQIGISSISFTLSGEFFPMNTRDVGIGLANAFGYCFIFIANKIFMDMVNDVELTCVFAFFGAVNFIGSVLLYFILLETRGKSTLEIAKHFDNGYSKNIDSKKNNIDLPEETTVSMDIKQKILLTKLKSMFLRKV